MLSSVSAFVDHLIIFERLGGLPKVRVQKLSTQEERELTFPEPTYSVYEGNNPEFNTTTWRFNYSSLITPFSVFDYDLEKGDRELRSSDYT
ncbi:MAG: hypothetical protein HC770_13495 [Pseudanabaena sp. CRU_2_10]|nr:hypothetical protein [Pseudanabaena sp. CRU_2_10]